MKIRTFSAAGASMVIALIPVMATIAQSDSPDRQAPPGARTIKLTNVVNLRFGGFLPGEKVRIVVHSDPLPGGTFIANAKGVIEASVSAPGKADVIRVPSTPLNLTGRPAIRA